MVQNTAARVLCNIGKFDHVTPVLKKLHWLPIEWRVKFKVCLIVFKSIHGSGPQYIKDMLIERQYKYGLRYGSEHILSVPKTKYKTLGDRAFSASAPKIWNELPRDLRSTLCLASFKTKLKTHFFNKAYLL